MLPILNSRLGCSPLGAEKENLWRREVKKRNNSILASCSPRHTRLPEDTQYNRWGVFTQLLTDSLWPCNAAAAQSLTQTKNKTWTLISPSYGKMTACKKWHVSFFHFLLLSRLNNIQSHEKAFVLCLTSSIDYLQTSPRSVDHAHTYISDRMIPPGKD